MSPSVPVPFLARCRRHVPVRHFWVGAHSASLMFDLLFVHVGDPDKDPNGKLILFPAGASTVSLSIVNNGASGRKRCSKRLGGNCRAGLRCAPSSESRPRIRSSKSGPTSATDPTLTTARARVSQQDNPKSMVHLKSSAASLICSSDLWSRRWRTTARSPEKQS